MIVYVTSSGMPWTPERIEESRKREEARQAELRHVYEHASRFTVADAIEALQSFDPTLPLVSFEIENEDGTRDRLAIKGFGITTAEYFDLAGKCAGLGLVVEALDEVKP